MFHGVAGTAERLKHLSGGGHLPAVWQFTDADRLPDPLSVIEHLPQGSGVVFRHFGRAAYRDLGAGVRAVCKKRGLIFLVGADEALAIGLAADGLHMPERMADQRQALRERHPGWILTTAVHSCAGVKQAHGFDAIFASPIFPSASPSAGAPVGIGTLTEWVKVSPCPVFALGGVTSVTVGALIGTGCAGIAGVGFAA